MGRHATVAGRQASSAAYRSKLFTRLTRELSIAAKLGGSDPNSNPRLRLAMDHAKENNMPKDTIDRAVKKGAGELDGVTYEEITYEAYAIKGIAVLMEIMTDNRNRTMPEIKRILQKNHATWAEQGAVSWMFTKKGVIDIALANQNEDQIMELALEAGAEDVVVDSEIATIYSDTSSFVSIKEALAKSNIKPEKAGLELVSSTTIDVKGEEAQVVSALINALEEHDDVQNVYHNANFVE